MILDNGLDGIAQFFLKKKKRRTKSDATIIEIGNRCFFSKIKRDETGDQSRKITVLKIESSDH